MLERKKVAVSPLRFDPDSGRFARAIRLPAAAAVSAVLLGLLWRTVPNGLSVRTGTIGNPIFAGYDYKRLQYGFYFIAFGFPLLTLLIFGLLGRSSVFGDHRDGRPARFPILTDLNLDIGGRPTHDPRSGLTTAGVGFRVAVPAALLALEASEIAGADRNPFGWFGLLIGVLYVAFVLVIAAGFQTTRKGGHRSDGRGVITARGVIAVNGAAALTTVPLFGLVARSSQVTVLHPHQVVHFRWMPWWVILVLTAVAAAVWLMWRSGGAEQPPENSASERVLLWIVGPIWVFALAGVLPGALGTFQGFDDAQDLAAPQLVFHHGLVPYKDLYLLHGPIEDLLRGSLGLLLFGSSRWAGSAGALAIVTPLQWVILYLLVAGASGRNKWIPALFVLVMAGGAVMIGTTRFMFLPIYLLVFHGVIRSPSWGRCVLFALTMFVGTILSPEQALFVLCSYGVLVLFEATGYRRDQGPIPNFVRTIRTTVAGLIIVGLWFAILALGGAVSDFLEFYLANGFNLSLEGAHAGIWKLASLPKFTFEFWAPVAIWIVTIWWGVARVRAGRVWIARDWTLVAAATYALVYFPKVLNRLDGGHVVEVFTVAFPALLLLAITALGWSEGRLSRYTSRGFTDGASRWVVSPAVCVALLAIGASGAFPLYHTLRTSAGRLQAVVPQPPPVNLKKLGYVIPGSVDVDEILNLGRILDTYAPPGSPILDYANEPGLTNYLLNYTPGTRIYPIELADSPTAQIEAIKDLRKSDPRVVIFSATDFGLVNYDSIPQSVRSYRVSRYILTHYKPLVDYSGQLLLLRDDLFSGVAPLPSLLGQVYSTDDLYSASPECNFGEIPNYFAYPSDLFRRRTVAARVVPVATGVRGTQRTFQLRFPPGTDLSAYEWLEVQAPQGLGASKFGLSSSENASAGNEIAFQARIHAPSQEAIMAGSCLQWYGYSSGSSARLYLTVTGAAQSGLRVDLVSGGF